MESYISSPLVKSFLAGSLSGTCSTILFQPLDLIKTRLQNANCVQGRCPGVMAITGNILRNETARGMWRGLTPSLTRTVPGIGVYFCSLHTLRNNFGSADPQPMESIAMGAFARTISGLSMIPFTVVKTRYESGNFKYNSVPHALRTIYRLEGARGLSAGLSATLLRDAPFSGIYLMFYTQGKKAVLRTDLDNYVGRPVVFFGCGIVAGFLASIVTQPCDVIKTHMQLQPDKFRSAHTAVVYILQREGWQGFLRGLVPRTVRRSLMAALAWTVYEQLMVNLGIK